MQKTIKLKSLIQSNQTEFIMEAHNGLSAKIAEEAGFEGIWASGLTISAALGVRDSNEASWTQVLEVVEFMSDNTSIPILFDGDTGFGNYNNVRRLIRKLEQRGVAGVTIEDKTFPKTNSFIDNKHQALIDINEFVGKIKAAKDSQHDDNFVVVARTEAFIAGAGLSEALKRAEEYRQAGADAILVHSKQATAAEIEEFLQAWEGRHPVVIVPTTYHSTLKDFFHSHVPNLVIWANHGLRSAIKAMQDTAQQIFKEQSLIDTEQTIVPLAEVFRLQNMDELKAADKQYLPDG